MKIKPLLFWIPLIGLWFTRYGPCSNSSFFDRPISFFLAGYWHAAWVAIVLVGALVGIMQIFGASVAGVLFSLSVALSIWAGIKYRE